MTTSDEVRKKHAEYLFPSVGNFYKEPTVLTDGKGTRLTDLDGNEYLDFFGGILTVSIGHSNEEVNAAVIAQIQRLMTLISSDININDVRELTAFD